ncbi:MAG TPA: nucleotidyltransferase family protein [Acidimicrobiales bacterium]|nr:nucleotidyltransferase family protein [Acidimicrobiales bacterium]
MVDGDTQRAKFHRHAEFFLGLAPGGLGDRLTPLDAPAGHGEIVLSGAMTFDQCQASLPDDDNPGTIFVLPAHRVVKDRTAVTNPTAALLWAACRPTPSLDDVATAIAHGADLDDAANLAVAQRVSPLLWRAISQAGLVRSDEAWADTLERDAQRCRAQSRMVLPQIGRLALEPLAAAGVEPLVIKGAAVAPRYPDAGLRPMDDVDVIIVDHQIDAALAQLEGCGWEIHTPPQRRQFELDITHPSLPGLHIDLHRGLDSWRTRANRLTSDNLWRSRQPTTLYGAPAFVLPPELELVSMAAHAAKPYHGFDRLIWIVDIAVVAQAGVDWDTVAYIAHEAHCRTAVAVALTLAARIGTESPEGLRRIDNGRAAALAPVLSEDWPVRGRAAAPRTTLRYALVDDRRTRATLLVSELFDKNVWQVPRRAARLARRRLK